MKNLFEKYGGSALVAGAAEGLGEGFSMALAEAGFRLVLVDRNKEALEQLSERLTHEFAVQHRLIHLDLGDPSASSECLEAAREAGCRLIVYVAAWSRVSLFTGLAPGELDSSLAVNVHTPLHLVHGFTRRLQAEGQFGGIILVSSLAGLIGPKYVGAYAATKSYLLRLAESLHGELKGSGIDILACCAGTISTPAYWKSKPDHSRIVPAVMLPSEVAKHALKKLGKGPACIPGRQNRFHYFLLERLLPRSLARRLVNGAMEKMYGTSFRSHQGQEGLPQTGASV